MAKVTEHIANAKGKTLFSFEILPPMKGQGIQNLFNAVEPLMEMDPKFIDVTYHREEYMYKKRENGLLEKVALRKRPGTVGICAALMNRFHIDTVPHIICGGFTKEETENALIDLQFLGIDNVLALRGDAIKTEGRFTPTPGGHRFASDLIEQVTSMNKGNYLNYEVENARPTDFCVGVAGYPEKHFEAPNFNVDMDYLKKKVELGADYIVTQMFYDNSKYFEFVDKCREMDINIPIIPGLKPISTKSQLTVLPSIFHIDLPCDLVDAVNACKTTDAIREVGVEWAIMQSKELKERGASCLHYYTMGKSDNVVKIAREIF
jgi:methylenetetrahydrofolate reductase (NADPH)